MKRIMILVYGIVAYASFVIAILYLVGFIGDLVVPKSIDRPAPAPGGSMPGDLFTNLGLIGLFGLQHSVMARSGFKNRLLRFLPQAAERSTFVLSTSVVFGIMFYLWRPMTATIWEFESTVVELLLFGVFFSGWSIALVSTFAINHFDLFGLRQVVLEWQRRSYSDPEFSKSGLYRIVRHPINLGFLIAVWSSSHMTAGHLLFAAAMTAYIFGATILEERDLIAAHGDKYRKYRREVPMILPTRRDRNSS